MSPLDCALPLLLETGHSPHQNIINLDELASGICLLPLFYLSAGVTDMWGVGIRTQNLVLAQQGLY